MADEHIEGKGHCWHNNLDGTMWCCRCKQGLRELVSVLDDLHGDTETVTEGAADTTILTDDWMTDWMAEGTL